MKCRHKILVLTENISTKKKMSCNMSATYVGSTSDIIALSFVFARPSTTVNHPPSTTLYLHRSWRSRIASPCTRLPLHQKPPGQFWQSPLPRNPVRTIRSFSPVRQFAPNYIFWSLRIRRQGAAVSTPEGKETKQRAGKYLFAPWHAAAGIGAATTLRCIIFWSIVLLSLE